MKNILFILSSFMVTTAFAKDVSVTCTKLAEASVSKIAQDKKYDKEGIYAYECNLAANKRTVLCEVAAEASDGDTIHTYKVLLDGQCRKTYRTDLVTE